MEKNHGKLNIPAKVNLSLVITGVKGALHTLDMETVAVDLYDTVTYKKTESGGIVIDYTSSLSDFDKDRFRPVVESAVSKFVAEYGNTDCHILIEKNLPLGAGIGGSSTAVVGVLKALENLKNIRLDDRFLLTIGSDIPVVYRGGHNRVTGVGDVVEALEPIFKHFVILVKGGVDSGKAYRLYDEIGAECFGPRRNDLEKAAREINPAVKTAREILENLGAKDVVMSGSGSAVVAIFDDEASAKSVFDRIDGFNKFLTKTF